MKIKKIIITISFIISIFTIGILYSSKITKSYNNISRIEKLQHKSNEIILSEENEWKTVMKLDKYDENGKIITYEIDEKKIPKGYSKSINGTTITNKINNYKYYIEYYLDGIKKEELTETNTAEYNKEISTYIDKIGDNSKYKLDRVENIGMKISTDEEKNIIKVYYISKENFEKPGEIIERHVNSITNELLEEQIIHKGNVGDNYNINSKEFKDFILDKEKIPQNTTGIIGEETIIVTYYYMPKTGKVTVEYIDKATNEPIEENKTITGYINNEYEIIPKEISGYTLVKTPENSIGIIKEIETKVTCYYLKNTKIIINHIDKANNQKLKQEIIEGYETNDYKTEAEQFEGYDLVKEPQNKTGKMQKDPIEINYYYSYKSKITINHVEKNTRKLLKQEIKTGYEGEKIKTNESEFEYYKIVKKPTVEEYTLNKKSIEVIYEYRPLKFNIKLEQEIEKIILNKQEKEINNTICKLEIPQKQMQNNIEIYYKIRVTNNSEIDGNTEIYTCIPDGYKLIPEKNIEWNINNNIVTKKVSNLKIGETREFILVLTNIEEYNIPTITNTIIAQKSNNKAEIDETTLEDNSQTTKCIISISTGIEKNYKNILNYLLALLINLALILLILRHKKK